MPTGDGLLARIHPPLGVLTLTQARSIAEAARLYGNGHLDLTARANLQIRGVSEATREPLAGLLVAAGLGDTRTDGGPQRLTLTRPLAGRDPAEVIDTAALAVAVEAAGRTLQGLPAKTLVSVGPLLDEADLSLVPLAADRVAIIPASASVPAADCAPDDVPATVGALLSAFVLTGRRRMREVRAEDWSRALAQLPAQDECRSGAVGTRDFASPLALTMLAPAPGLSRLGTLPVLALDAPFGRCTAAAFERLIAVAEECRAPDLRLSPSRGIVMLPADPETAQARLDALSADFITGAGDPRRAVAACTGAPACASGTTPTLADAARLAEAFRPLAERGLSAHVSGCAKGCAKPSPADLTLVGREGAYAVVVGGSPDDPSFLHIPIEAAMERLGRAATVGLAAAFVPGAIDGGRNRRPA